MLYTIKNPNALRSLIGTDLTVDFVEFCRSQRISLDDVLNKNYKPEDLVMNLSAKYSTVVGLCKVDEKNVKVVRDFVERLGSELLSLFDNIWAGNNEERLEIIASLRELDDSQVINMKLK